MAALDPVSIRHEVDGEVTLTRGVGGCVLNVPAPFANSLAKIKQLGERAEMTAFDV